MKTSIPSPARSLGAPRTPRWVKSRGTRSVGSPARSDVSEKLMTVADNFRESQGSFGLSPMNRKSILTDNTDIEEPRRKSWYKKLDDTTQEVMEVLRSDKINNANKAVEEYVDVEVFSQERKSISMDIPDSSGSETIGSIVLPQRRLFTEKENKPVKTFGKLLGPRESLAKLQKTTTEADKAANVGPKQLFSHAPQQRSRPAFPAGLLAVTPNTTRPSEEEVAEAQPKRLFGQEKATKKKTFTSALLESSPKKNNNNEQETAGPSKLFGKESQQKIKPIFPAELLDVSANRTAPNKTKEAAVSEVKGQVRNLFGNRVGVKRKNMFADFIVSESDDEIQDVQPKIFAFPKGSKSRGSSVSRGGREASPLSNTTDIELDDWKMLPSSTMMVDQLEYMVTGTPMKKMRLSKLSEQKESDGSKASTTVNKTKVANKSVSSKNKSITTQDSSKLKIDENEMVVEKDDLEKMSKTKTLTEIGNMGNVNEKITKVQANDDKIDDIVVENNATYNIKNRTHSIHKNTTNMSNADEEINQKELEMQTADQEIKLDAVDKTKANSFKKADTQINDDDDEVMALTYEEDAEEPIIEEVQENQGQNNQTQEKIKDIEPTNNKEVIEEIKQNKSKTVVQTEIVSETQDKKIATSKHNAIAVDDYADDNFEEAIEDDRLNVESVLKDDVSELIEDNHDSKLEISTQNPEVEVEESIEQIQKEIERGKSEVRGKEIENNAVIEQNNIEAQQNYMTKEKSLDIELEQDNVEFKLNQEEIENNEEKNPQSEEVIEQNKEQSQEIYQNEVNEDEAERSKAVAETTHEAIKNEDEIEQEDVEIGENEKDEEEDEEQNEIEIEQPEDEKEQDEEDDGELNETEMEQAEDDVEQNEEEDDDQNETEIEAEDDTEQNEEEDEEQIETDLQQTEEDLDENQEEIEEEEEEEQEQNGAELEQIEEDHEESMEDVEQDVEENEEQSDNEENFEQTQEENEDSHANMPSEQIKTPEDTEEILESPNVSHDTTGRNRKKKVNETNLKSPEIALKGTATRNNSFQTHNRDNSLRKTKSIIIPSDHVPSMAASIRDSIGTNGTNSSGQGSGWDSHRTTRKTLRQTFGKDFTPRKSLRALVMEKSAQRHTLANVDVENIKLPQANSTEINTELSVPSLVDNVEDLMEDTVSDHDASRRTRQMTLDMYLQKIKKDTLERRMKMENAVRESLKAPQRDLTSAFKLPSKLGSGVRKGLKPATKPRKTKHSPRQPGPLPPELIKDLKDYKPPKRFRPSNASWTTKRLYKFLETKLEPKYDYKARVRAEKLMETIHSFSELIKREPVAPQVAIDQLKHEMARLNVVRTHFEFYEFFHEFMPREMRIKVIPDIQNKLPMPREGIYAGIIRE